MSPAGWALRIAGLLVLLLVFGLAGAVYLGLPFWVGAAAGFCLFAFVTGTNE